MITAKQNRQSLFVLFSVVVIDLIGFGVIIPILPFYAESYGANATILGLLLSAHAAMQLLFSPCWGRLSDKIGRKPVLLITIAGTALALALLGWASSLAWLFAARLLGGFFGANISVATAYVTDITTEENRTRGMGLIGAAFGIGFVLGPALGGFLAPHGYHTPMYVAACLAVLNFIYAAVILREPSRHEEHPEVIPNTHVLRDRVVRKLCLINLLFTIAMTQLEATFAFFMMDRFHYDARAVAYLLVMVATVMALVQGGAIRPLAKSFGEKKLVLGGALLVVASFVSVPQIYSVPLLLIPLLVYAVGRSIAQPSLLSLVSRGGHPRRTGAVMGTYQSSASLARIVGPAAAGLLYDQANAFPFYFASFLLLIISAVMFEKNSRIG
ncbi:MAG: MFS transporter [Deltaproteobacteria bacterium]|nr:MFS transporter [Deltaproteobacteria bacterium]